MKIIENGILVTPSGKKAASLAMEGGRIVKIGAITPAEGDEIIDASGCYVFPGFIDGHTHLDLPVGGQVTADDFESGTRAAAAGGTTCIVDFATQYKGDTLLGALDKWKKKAEGKAHVNYAFHMAVCDWNEQIKAELPELRHAGVSSIKVYMAYDTALTDDQIYELLTAVKPMGAVVGCHCENGAMISARTKELKAKGKLTPDAHPLAHPAEAEAEAVNRFCYLGRLTGCPVNIVHLSTRLGLMEVRAARAEGVKVFVESCPQYMILDESLYGLGDFEAAKYVMSPPLRKRADIDALKKAVLEGEIDTIATDHCSFRFDTQKTLGKDDFTKIPNGGPGIEHRPVILHKIFGDALDVNGYMKLLSENPARVFGMYPRKGALLEGSDADITIWDPNVRWTIHAVEQEQKVDYTPYENFDVTGQARYVFVNEELAAEKGRSTSLHAGRYVAR